MCGKSHYPLVVLLALLAAFVDSVALDMLPSSVLISRLFVALFVCLF